MLRMGIREVSQEKVTLEFCLLETSIVSNGAGLFFLYWDSNFDLPRVMKVMKATGACESRSPDCRKGNKQKRVI